MSSKQVEDKLKIAKLETELKNEYLKIGKDKVEEHLANIFTELELSKAGERVFGDYGEFSKTIPSTFPKWIPKELRSKSLFEKVIGRLEINNLKFPSGSKQRKLYNTLLTELDARLGIDTLGTRSKIINLYENNQQKGIAEAISGGVKRGEITNEDINKSSWGEKTTNDSITLSSELIPGLSTFISQDVIPKGTGFISGITDLPHIA